MLNGARVPVHAPHRALLEQRRAGLAAAAATAAEAGAVGMRLVAAAQSERRNL
jgi:hypothetical protein